MADEENQTNPRPASSQSGTAVEHTQPEVQTNGYLKLAQFMGEFPQYAIYRRFGTLNAMNLLMLQAELVMLEAQLRQYVGEDNVSVDSLTRLYDKDFPLSSGRRPWIRKGKSRQYKIMLRIRQILRQYNQEVLVQSQLAGLPKPHGRHLDYVRLWKKNTTRGGSVYLTGDDDTVWEDWDLRELQCIRAPHYDDAISAWLTRHAIHWYHKIIGKLYRTAKPDSNAGTPAYSHEGMKRVVFTLSIVLSSIFPIASILILHRVKCLEVRLWIIVAFTIVFAACVGAFSPGKRVETFAATMAFAAVQVVFVSNPT